MTTTQSMLRMPALKVRTGRGRSTNYHDIARGLMVPPVAMGDRCATWPSDEVDRIIAARIAGRSDDEIRQLVRDLVAARRTADTDSEHRARAPP